MTTDEKLEAILSILSDTADQPANPSSTPSSPTPPTSPTPTSDVLVTMMTTAIATIREMAETNMRETRAMVLDLIQGRQTQPLLPQETTLTESDSLLSFDYDSTPLSPGIQAILVREEAESDALSAQQLLLKERAYLQQKIALAKEEADLLEVASEDLLPGPWDNSHDPETTQPIS